MPMLKVKMSEVSPGESFREKIDWNRVAELAEKLERGMSLPPPMTVKEGGGYRVTSGAHRYLAHKEAGREEIEIQVMEGEPAELDLLLDAWGENQDRHGFNAREQSRVIVALMKLGKSQAEIAGLLKLSRATVNKRVMVDAKVAPDIQEMIARGELDPSKAHLVRDLPWEKQRELVKGNPKKEWLVRQVKLAKGERVRKSKPRKASADGVTLSFDGSMDGKAVIAAVKAMVKRMK